MLHSLKQLKKFIKFNTSSGAEPLGPRGSDGTPAAIPQNLEDLSTK